MPTKNTPVEIEDIEYFDGLVDGRIIKNRVQAISVTVDKAEKHDEMMSQRPRHK
jgi:hypothetical protein